MAEWDDSEPLALKSLAHAVRANYVSTVGYHLRRMVKDGLIEHLDWKRDWVLTPAGHELAEWLRSAPART